MSLEDALALEADRRQRERDDRAARERARQAAQEAEDQRRASEEETRRQRERAQREARRAAQQRTQDENRERRREPCPTCGGYHDPGDPHVVRTDQGGDLDTDLKAALAFEAQQQAERERRAEIERQRRAELERQRLAEIERQRLADMEAALERERQAETERQAEREREAERKRQAELARQRQAYGSMDGDDPNDPQVREAPERRTKTVEIPDYLSQARGDDPSADAAVAPVNAEGDPLRQRPDGQYEKLTTDAPGPASVKTTAIPDLLSQARGDDPSADAAVAPVNADGDPLRQRPDGQYEKLTADEPPPADGSPYSQEALAAMTEGERSALESSGTEGLREYQEAMANQGGTVAERPPTPMPTPEQDDEQFEGFRSERPPTPMPTPEQDDEQFERSTSARTADPSAGDAALFQDLPDSVQEERRQEASDSIPKRDLDEVRDVFEEVPDAPEGSPRDRSLSEKLTGTSLLQKPVRAIDHALGEIAKKVTTEAGAYRPTAEQIENAPAAFRAKLGEQGPEYLQWYDGLSKEDQTTLAVADQDPRKLSGFDITKMLTASVDLSPNPPKEGV